jgi:hypothetical protein
LSDSGLLYIVIPAEAGIQEIRSRLYSGQRLDPGFRRDDEWQHSITFGERHKAALAFNY